MDGFQKLPYWLLMPVPLKILQPILQRLVSKLFIQRADLFARLGACKVKCYLIDPTNLPFAFLLCPNPDQPSLTACRRSHLPKYDARITATFLTLIDLIDGYQDGDAVFFNRDLVLEGDVEAIVVLRNAIDDLDGSIIDDIAGNFSIPTKAALSAIRRFRRSKHEPK